MLSNYLELQNLKVELVS